jgi:undecaprenyl pyrophosphate synthase
MTLNHILYGQHAKVALSCPGLAALLIQPKKHKPLSRLTKASQASNSYLEDLCYSRRYQSRGELVRLNALSSSEVSPSSPPTATSAAAGLPNHLAVIMDGNSRWAHQRGLPAFSGHQSGVDAMRRTVEFSCKQGIHCLTVFAFSSENWQRTSAEVDFLLMLIERVVKKELEELVAVGVNMKFIGDRSKLPSSLREQMKRYAIDF